MASCRVCPHDSAFCRDMQEARNRGQPWRRPNMTDSLGRTRKLTGWFIPSGLDSFHVVIEYWLVGRLFWVYRPFETVFQSISGRLPKRGRKRRERIDESKNVQTTPPAPTASAIGPCPTVIQIVGRPGTVYPTPSHHPTTPCN